MPELFHYSSALGKTDPRILTLMFNITGAKTSVTRPLGPPVLTAYDAIAAQATIDNFLGTTSEFNYLAFDATSMGTDAFGVIVNMNGQAGYLLAAEAKQMSGTNFGTVVNSIGLGTGLTATTLATEAALGANGNLAARFVLTNLDGLTTGIVMVRFYWIAK